MSARDGPGAGTSTRRLGVDAVAATLVALLIACQSPPRDVEGIVRTALERRAWPATSVLVVDRGRVLANVGHRTPPERDPQDLVHPLGSIAKMFTAAVVHRLAERGEVALGARVAEYLPDWPPSWNAVRVHQLLGHTRFSYSNTAYHAAARIIRSADGLLAQGGERRRRKPRHARSPADQPDERHEGVLIVSFPAAVPPPPATGPSSRRPCRSAPSQLRYCPNGSP
jgi:hypothetical protein